MQGFTLGLVLHNRGLRLLNVSVLRVAIPTGIPNFPLSGCFVGELAGPAHPL